MIPPYYMLTPGAQPTAPWVAVPNWCSHCNVGSSTEVDCWFCGNPQNTYRATYGVAGPDPHRAAPQAFLPTSQALLIPHAKPDKQLLTIITKILNTPRSTASAE